MNISVLSWTGSPVLENGHWYIDVRVILESDHGGRTVIRSEVNGRSAETEVDVEKGRFSSLFRIDAGDVELWHTNTEGRPHVYPLQLFMNEWTQSRPVAFYTYEIQDGMATVNGKRIKLRGAVSRMKEGVRYESLIKSAEISSLNAIVLSGDEDEDFTAACHRAGLLPLMEDQLPPSVVHIESKKCREGDYLPEIQQALDVCDRISAVRPCSDNAGFIIHSLNDVDDGVEDGAMTSQGKWKLLQYALRRFSAPLCPFVMVRDGKIEAYVANDSLKDEKVELSVKVRDFSGRKHEAREHALTVPALSSVLVDTLSIRYPSDKVFCYVRMASKDLLRERTRLLSADASLEDPEIKVSVNRTGSRTLSITVTAEKPAFYVSFSSGCIEGLFSDNMIAVRPTAEKTVIFQSADEVDIEEFRKELKVYDLYSALKI